MELAIALVSIVSGAAVAIVVPFINARLERRRLDAQTEAARLDELRNLVDSALRNLYDAWTILYEIDQELGRERSHWSMERWRGWSEKFTRQFDVIVHDGLRIELRTPEGSAVLRRHRAAQSSFVGYELALRQFLDRADDAAAPPAPPERELIQAIAAFAAAVRAHLGVPAPASRAAA